MNYLLIPGNPPAAYFYELWAKEIQLKQPESKVRVSHYPDMKNSNDSVEAMDEVMSFHLKQLELFYSETSTPVTLVGHSLGGHFALGLVSRAPEWINKAILLHPFLRKPSLLGLLTLNAAGSLYRAESLQNAFLGSKKGLEALFPDLAHVTKAEALRSFHLARHESQTIGKDDTPLEIEPQLRDKIQVFYNRSDIWCTPEVINGLRAQVSVHQCSEPHGFVTKAQHRGSLFDRFY